MSMEGSVAVITPCFNDGATLQETLASVQAQDVPAEIIVVDDGSTDPGTAAVLARAQAAGVRVIRQRNQGPSAARTKGLEATSADYVLPLDADDLLAPEALRRLRDLLDAEPGAAAAWGSVRHFGALDYVQRSLPSLDPWQITYYNHMPLGALYRRAAVLAVGGWDLRGGYEDWDVWMALAEHGWKGIGVAPVTGLYRVHGGRRLADSSRRHGERYETLRARHPRLFAERARNRRASPAPRLLKLALPVVDALPVSPPHKRLLGGAASQLAYRNGWRVVAARYRAQRFLRGQPSSNGRGPSPAASDRD